MVRLLTGKPKFQNKIPKEILTPEERHQRMIENRIQRRRKKQGKKHPLVRQERKVDKYGILID